MMMMMFITIFAGDYSSKGLFVFFFFFFVFCSFSPLVLFPPTRFQLGRYRELATWSRAARY